MKISEIFFKHTIAKIKFANLQIAELDKRKFKRTESSKCNRQHVKIQIISIMSRAFKY